MGRPAFALQPRTLFIQYSDSHGSYENLDAFIRSISVISQRFLREYPGGRVILSSLGDIGGWNLYTDDDLGDHSFNLIAKLSKYYYPLTILGNHEGFDFVGSTREEGLPGNSIFYLQTREFLDRLRSARPDVPSAVLAANLDLTDLARPLFRPFHDLPGEPRIRVIGLVTDELIANSSYDDQSDLQLIRRVLPMYETAQRQLELAARDGVGTVIFQCHEEALRMRPLIRELLGWKSRRPDLDSVQISFFGGGHDHYVVHETIEKVPYIEAGENYAFSTVQLNGSRVESVNHYSHAEQVRRFGSFSGLRPEERQLLEEAKLIVRHVDAANSEPLGRIRAIPETKMHLKAGRTELGDILAQVLVDWGEERLAAEPGLPVYERVIAFMNSAGYRLTTPLPEGELTPALIKRMRPFDRRAGVMLIPGHHVQEMFAELRAFKARENEYCPQIPECMAESLDYRLLVRNGDGLMHPLRPDALYAVVFDDYLLKNYYRLSSFDRGMAAAAWRDSHGPTTRDLMMFHLPRLLSTQRACRNILAH